MSSPLIRLYAGMFACDICGNLWYPDQCHRRGPDDSALRCPSCGGECFLWQSDEDDEEGGTMPGYAEGTTVAEDGPFVITANDRIRYKVWSFRNGEVWIIERQRRALRRSKSYDRGDWRYDETFPFQRFGTKDAAIAQARILAGEDAPVGREGIEPSTGGL